MSAAPLLYKLTLDFSGLPSSNKFFRSDPVVRTSFRPDLPILHVVLHRHEYRTRILAEILVVRLQEMQVVTIVPHEDENLEEGTMCQNILEKAAVIIRMDPIDREIERNMGQAWEASESDGPVMRGARVTVEYVEVGDVSEHRVVEVNSC